jgi:oligopeptide/dipeptide ABC transporter ATP-binding protein
VAGYILRRGLEVIPTVLLVLTLVFLALRVLPGDPAIAALGEYATPEAIATFREKLGLDQPLWVQYLCFVGRALTGDFGRSMTNGTSINALLLSSLPYTIELALAATFIGMMYLGKLVEVAESEALFDAPFHPYTQALLSAAPVPDPERRATRIILRGDAPSPSRVPFGCQFHPRCPIGQAVCRTDAQALREATQGRLVACHFARAFPIAA